MPLYIADYLAGTTHLNTLQHGAYLLLIMHYWSKGGLPSDEESIRHITRLDVRSWRKNRDTLIGFFEDGWKHARLDKELAQAIAISQANSANARKSHENRRRSAADRQVRSHTQSQSPSQTLPAGESDARPAAHEGIAKMVPMDWQPSQANVQAARDAGLSDEETEAQAARFRKYNRARGTKFTDIDEAWAAWVLLSKPAEKPGSAIPEAPPPPDWDNIASFWVRAGRWQRGHGPEPGMGGCRCPPEILEKHGIDPATGMVKRKGAA